MSANGYTPDPHIKALLAPLSPAQLRRLGAALDEIGRSGERTVDFEALIETVKNAPPIADEQTNSEFFNLEGAKPGSVMGPPPGPEIGHGRRFELLLDGVDADEIPARFAREWNEVAAMVLAGKTERQAWDVIRARDNGHPASSAGRRTNGTLPRLGRAGSNGSRQRRTKLESD